MILKKEMLIKFNYLHYNEENESVFSFKQKSQKLSC